MPNTPYTLDPDALSETNFAQPDNIQQNDDGSVDVNVQANDSAQASDYDHYENIAEFLDEEVLAKIATDVIDGCQADMQSCKPWSDTICKGLELLGIELKEMTEPFEGACGATHPMILEAAVKFQAKAAKELFPPVGPVKCQVLGKRDEKKQLQASRVQEHMNYQVNEQIEEYFPDMENLLLYLPIVGLAYKKITPDLIRQCPAVEFVPADQLVVPANAVDLKKCARYTHILYKNELDLKRDQTHGVYADVDLGQPARPELTDISKKFNKLIGIVSAVNEQDEAYTLYEQHCYLELPEPYGDKLGLACPYVVTVDVSSKTVLSIRRNWKVDDSDRNKRVWFVKYPFVPGFGFYSLGFIHLLGNFELTITAAMRSLVDSAQFATLQGGFRAKGIKMANNNPHVPGEWKEVEATGVDLSKALVPLPYKEPSPTMLAMLQYLEGRGQQFADSTEAVVSDAANYGPVGTTLALLEASTKFFSGIHKRLHYAQKQEFRIIAEINREFLPKEYPFDVVGGDRVIYAEDYDPANISIIPGSDPNISSNAHKMALAQTKLQVAQMFPQHVNPKPVLRDMFMCMDDGSDIDMYITPEQPPAQPQDPVTDLMAASKGLPIQAFPGQDHDSHVKVKSMWLNDPHNGKNPIFAAVAPNIQSNIRDHLMLKYQETMQGAMQNIQQQNANMPEEIAIKLAADMVARNNAVQAEVDGIQDPMLIAALAQKQDAQNQKQKIEYDHMEELARLELDKEKLEREAGNMQKTVGLDLVNKSLDRMSKAAMEDKKLETQKEIAAMKPKPKPTDKK